ncbi:MAG: hypothetical protein HRT45_11680 [Bdellovibrionales bacterium]|nr:hypothetical protein [Bdellovibrionales bacterium]
MGKFKAKTLPFFMILTVWLSACDNSPSHDKMPTKAKDLDPALTELASQPKQIDFEVVKQIFQNNRCLECHNSQNSKAGVNLETYESTIAISERGKLIVEPRQPQQSSLYQVLRASGKRQMPPEPSQRLSDIEQLIVYHWINEGAVEVAEAIADEPIETEDPIEPPVHISEELEDYFKNPQTIDFEVVDQYVFSTSCNDCHSQNGSKPDAEAYNSLDLTNYNSMFFSVYGVPFVKGKPYSTGAYQTVAFDQSMPPTKEGYRLLDPYRAKLMRLWILNCAIEEYDDDADENLLRRGDKRRVCEGEG